MSLARFKEFSSSFYYTPGHLPAVGHFFVPQNANARGPGLCSGGKGGGEVHEHCCNLLMHNNITTTVAIHFFFVL